MDRNSQDTMVHLRIAWSQPTSRRFETSAAIAKANGMVMLMYPRYSMGGWITMPGFCSCGLSPLPSAGVNGSRSKGLDANSVTITKNRVVADVMAAT